jgi:gamma-butyrobetaine dioxygenase
VDEEKTLTLAWPDGHTTVYRPPWLRQHAYEHAARVARRFQPTLWNASLGQTLPEVSYEAVMASEAGLLEWMRHLRVVGVCLVRGVPAEPGTVGLVAQRISFLSNSNFGYIMEIQQPTPSPDKAVSTMYALKPHTDFANRELQPGLTFQHCLEFEAVGGETILVDGYYAAEELRRQNPAAFELLATTPIEFVYQDPDNVSRAKSPMIQMDADGGLSEIRYSNAQVAPLAIDPELVLPYYAAYFKFVSILRHPALEVTVHLRPGDLLSFHQRRVLHGRKAYNPNSGRCHLQTCHVDWDEFMSRLRVLEARRHSAIQ